MRKGNFTLCLYVLQAGELTVNVFTEEEVTVTVFPQAGGFPEPEIIHYNPKEFDFGKKKAFPFRDQVDQIHKSKQSSR